MIFNPFKNLPASQDFHSSPAIRRYEGNPMNVYNCSFSTLWEKLSLESNDIWATALLMLKPAIQQKAAELCPWETLTASQKRYMSLKSLALKKTFLPCKSLGKAAIHKEKNDQIIRVTPFICDSCLNMVHQK